MGAELPSRKNKQAQSRQLVLVAHWEPGEGPGPGSQKTLGNNFDSVAEGPGAGECPSLSLSGTTYPLRTRVRETWVQIPALPLPTAVWLRQGTSVSLSVPTYEVGIIIILSSFLK